MIENFPNEQINERSFSNPHPQLVTYWQVKYCYNSVIIIITTFHRGSTRGFCYHIPHLSPSIPVVSQQNRSLLESKQADLKPQRFSQSIKLFLEAICRIGVWLIDQ